MKTLVITLEYPPQVGGIASYIYNFMTHVSPEEFVVYAPIMKGGPIFDQKNKWKVYRYQPYWFFWPKWLRMFWQVRKIVKKEQIERLFIHQALPVGYVGRLVKKFNKIPYTIFLHGTDLEMATRHGWKRDRFKKICQSAERIVVNSIFLQNKLAQKIENLATPVQILYPSPADEFFTKVSDETLKKLRAELALNGKKVMITVARMVEGKGYPHLARLLPELIKEVPNLVWLIIGDGPKKPELLQTIQKNNLQNVVRFFGLVPREELPKYYQLSDLFALLTHADESQEEAWGTVFLEAAASGLPVVAGRAGGVEEAVEDRTAGFVVDTRQSGAVASVIVELLKNTEYAKQMGTAGRERTMREFTWEKQLLSLRA